MEFKVNEVEGLNEEEIVQMIYDKINIYWGGFPNLWNKVSKDEIASEVAIDLYRPRKADGVPHIIHYYKTKGERSLKPLIGLFVYNNLQAEARITYSTGNRNVEGRKNVYSPVYLDTPVPGSDGLTLGDSICDEKVDISRDIDYIMLVDSLPNKIVDGIYYKVGDKYTIVSYKYLLKNLLDGYNKSQISENLYKLNKSGNYTKFNDVGTLIKDMRNTFIDFLGSSYNYTTENYKRGETVL